MFLQCAHSCSWSCSRTNLFVFYTVPTVPSYMSYVCIDIEKCMFIGKFQSALGTRNKWEHSGKFQPNQPPNPASIPAMCRKDKAYNYTPNFWYLPRSLSLDFKFQFSVLIRASATAKTGYLESAEHFDYCADDQPLTVRILARPSFTPRPVPNCASVPHLPAAPRAQQLTRYSVKRPLHMPCCVDAASIAGQSIQTNQRVRHEPLPPRASVIPSLSLAVAGRPDRTGLQQAARLPGNPQYPHGPTLVTSGLASDLMPACNLLAISGLGGARGGMGVKYLGTSPRDRRGVFLRTPAKWSGGPPIYGWVKAFP